MKIFVVNLKRSADRRQLMESQLRKLGLEYEIFDAVDGANISQATIDKYFDKEFFLNRSQYYSMGAVGCALSHYYLYRKIVTEKIDKCLILEDDMILHNDLAKLLPSIEDQLTDDEIIMLFYQSRHPIDISFSAPLGGNEGKFNIFKVDDVKRLASTAGYLINYNTAKRMIKGLLPICTTADDWGIFDERDMFDRIRVVYPFLLSNSLATTTISPKLKDGSALRYIFDLVERRRIFPFHQLLKMRRKQTFARIQNIRITDNSAVV